MLTPLFKIKYYSKVIQHYSRINLEFRTQNLEFENMTTHIKSFEALTLDEFYEIARFREEVFFLEQKVDVEELDGLDQKCMHLWVEDAGSVVAYLRMLPAGLAYEQASIGRVAVKQTERKRGLGRQIMEEAIAWIEDNWLTGEIKISAQAYLVDFYRSLGFEVISDLYLEGGIEHYKMKKY